MSVHDVHCSAISGHFHNVKKIVNFRIICNLPSLQNFLICYYPSIEMSVRHGFSENCFLYKGGLVNKELKLE